MEEFKIPDNIPVIDKPEEYEKVIGVQPEQTPPPAITQQPVELKPGISIVERSFEGFNIPDNISVYEKPEDAYQVPSNVPVVENTKSEEKPEIKISEEELDIWKRIEEELGDVTTSNKFVSFDGEINKIDEKKLCEWLKEKLSGISFCQTYLTDKIDGDNGIVKENSTLMLKTDKGSKFFLNKAGKYHRLDGPAIEWMYGANEYFKNGIRHRIGGPAYENKDEKQFWFEGKQYSEVEYWKISQEIENLK
jgi:hypothetical protein